MPEDTQDAITPEQQRAWDIYQLALMEHLAQTGTQPTALTGDATHAIGVVFDAPKVVRAPLFPPRTLRGQVASFLRDMLAGNFCR